MDVNAGTMAVVSSSAAVAAQMKKAIRKALAGTLNKLSTSEIQIQSEAIHRLISSSRFFQRSKTVSCYLSMKGEVDTFGIAREILTTGKALYVPRIIDRKNNRMDFLRVYSVQDLESIPSGLWGIKEPDIEWDGRRRTNILDSDADPLDLILVPGVAFDTSLSRLGHGKGYYDSFINNYSRKIGCENPHLVALALKEQMLPIGEIPMESHDRKMDAIITADGIVG